MSSISVEGAIFTSPLLCVNVPALFQALPEFSEVIVVVPLVAINVQPLAIVRLPNE